MISPTAGVYRRPRKPLGVIRKEDVLGGLNPYLLFDAESSMIGTLENPTLDLDPAFPDTLDVITAVRAGVASFTDESGLIQSATANTVRVDHTQGAELTPTVYQNIGYTDFSSGWSNYNSTTTVGSGFENQPSRIIEGTVSNSNNYYFPVTTVDSQLYTYSLYVRRVSGTSSVSLVHTNSPTGTKTSINPTSEWQRFSVVFEGVSGGGTSAIGIEESLAGDSVEIAMPQVEEGTTASSFVANTTGSPKFITGATYGPRVPMILVEPSATNLVPSKGFSNIGTTTTVASGFLAPDGSMDAYEVSNILDNSSDRAYCVAATVSGSTEYTGSLYVKGTAGEVATFQAKRASAGAYVSSTTSVVTLTGSWQRVTGLTFTTAADNTQAVVSVRNESPTTTADTIQVWGAQLEAGSVATSYIPTSGSAVTRAADDLTITGSAFSDFFNASEGTVYAESVTKKSDGQPFVFSANTDSNNRIVYYNTTTATSVYVAANGVAQANLNVGNRPAAGTLSRGALSYKINNIEASVDGGGGVSDTSATIPSVNKLTIGTRITGEAIYYLNGHIKRLIYWPTHSDSL